MLIDISQTNPLDVYRLLISIVTPRPIAWVTSIDAEGRVNLAPFSFFNVFGADPPVVVFAPNRKRDRSKKDTLNNVETTKEFVINAAVADLAAEVNLSSARASTRPERGRADRFERVALGEGQAATTGRVARQPRMRAAASGPRRRKPPLRQSGHRRNRDDPRGRTSPRRARPDRSPQAPHHRPPRRAITTATRATSSK